jgi:photosystem II stability/assembly factor-like uncharacterized protein
MALALGVGLFATSALAGADESGIDVVYSATAHDAIFDIGIDGDYGVAVGAGGLVLTSNDAGATWTKGEALGELALLGADIHAHRSLAVGQNGQIFRRTDGAWQPVDSGAKERLLAVDSDGGDLVVAIGGFGYVLISRDGGLGWTRQSFDWEAVLNDFIEPHLYGIDVRGKVITIAGELGLILLSEDSGASWQKVRQGEESLFGLHLGGDGAGYAVGQKGLIIATRDGGRTWAPLESGSEANLLDVWATSSGEILVSGIRAALYSADAGASWQTLEAGDISVSWYQAVAGNRQGSPGFMVGHSGRIIDIERAINSLAR